MLLFFQCIFTAKEKRYSPITIWRESKNCHKELCHQKTDKSATRESENPRENHIFDDSEIDGRQPFGGADTHNGSRFRVCCAERDSENRCDKQGNCGTDVGREALIALQLDHVHANGFDDFISSERGAERHDNRTKNHHPNRERKLSVRRLTIGKKNAENHNAHEFLTVLSTVHKRHCRTAEDLSASKKSRCFSPVGFPENCFGKLGEQETTTKSENGREHQSIKYFYPFGTVDSVKVAVKSDSGTGKSCDKRMTLAGRNSEIPCKCCPDDNGEKRGAERCDRFFAVPVEIHHFLNGCGNGCIDKRHNKDTEKIKYSGHENRRSRRHRPCCDTCRNGIGCISPSVHENYAERKQYCDEKNGT